VAACSGGSRSRSSASKRSTSPPRAFSSRDQELVKLAPPTRRSAMVSSRERSRCGCGWCAVRRGVAEGPQLAEATDAPRCRRQHLASCVRPKQIDKRWVARVSPITPSARAASQRSFTGLVGEYGPADRPAGGWRARTQARASLRAEIGVGMSSAPASAMASGVPTLPGRRRLPRGLHNRDCRDWRSDRHGQGRARFTQNGATPTASAGRGGEDAAVMA